MNATPTNSHPVAALQAPPQAGRPADAADVPFDRVLSGQIARKADASRADGSADAAPQEAAASDGGDGARPTDPADPTAPAGETLAEADAAAVDAVLSQLPGDIPLGLPITPETTRGAAPATLEGAARETAARLGTALDRHAGSHARNAPLATATDGRPGRPAPADAQSGRDAATGLAAAFTERLAAARQGDPAAASERVAELMSQPATLRAPAPAPVTAAPEHDPAGGRLAPSVGTAAWSQALGDRLVWMATGNQQTASLTLNPPNLGPLQVVVNVSNDQATANFFAAQPEVRQALEAAFPRLREMMSEAGIQLGQATVSADTPGQQNEAPQRDGQRVASGFTAGEEPSPAGTVSTAVPRQGRGLVDTFA